MPPRRKGPPVSLPARLLSSFKDVFKVQIKNDDLLWRSALSPFLVKVKAVNFNHATSSNIRHLRSNSPADFTAALNARASSGVPTRRGIKAACVSSLAQRLSLKRRRLANFVPVFSCVFAG